MKETRKNSKITRTKLEKTPEQIEEGKKKRLKNLIPGANKNGRPKGKLNYDTRFDLAVEFLANEMIKKHNEDPKNKNNQWKISDVDIEGDLFAQAINKARNGSDKMLIDIFDRRYGKATQKVELSNRDGEAFKIALAEAEAEVEEWEKGWFSKEK